MKSTENSKIAWNTFFLYLRMGIIMFVKLYTTRIVLSALGADKYGVWSVVATFVLTFSTFSSPMVISVQRFLNFDMGKGARRLNIIFSTGLQLFFIFGAVILLLMETAGVWFVNNKMDFSGIGSNVVNLVFQFSIFSFLFQLIQKPYEAVIISYEKMSFYAIISIIEAVSWLGVAFIVKIDVGFDNLILYGLLTTIVSIVIFLTYYLYARKNFSCTRYKRIWDKSLIKEMSQFTGWNFFGALSAITSNEGLNILLNIFFGVVANAAYGLTNQVKVAVMTVIANVQKAFEPQIVKNYASTNIERMTSLAVSAIKMSYFLSFILIFPLIINLNLVLEIWLGRDVPEYTYIFIILTLCQLLLISFDGTIDSVVNAAGKIKFYILWVGLFNLINIAVIYLLFRHGNPPSSAFVVKIFVELGGQFIRFHYFRKTLMMRTDVLIRTVVWPIILFSITVVAIMCLVFKVIDCREDGWDIFGISLLYLPIAGVVSWIILLPRSQRMMLKSKLRRFIEGRFQKDKGS